MFESHFRTTNNDVNVIIRDAQAVLHEAATLTGERAVDARQRAMKLLDTAIVSAHDVHANAMVAGKEMAASADHYVKENPWKTISAAASIGLLLGVILGRK